LGCQLCPNLVVIPADWKNNNFQIVAPQKFPDIKVTMHKQVCSHALLKVPNAVVALSEILSKDQKIILYVADRKSKVRGYYESKWENIFLQFFGMNANFLILDQSRLDPIIKEQGLGMSGTVSLDKDPKVLKLAGVTHMFIVDRMQNEIKNAKMTGSLIDIDTGKVMTVDSIMD
ncbi:MAG TPA: hypothetical protein VLX29_01690, partial [Nitrospirota bacterium]|nr:hypothetical protein [Nitrospirota bacterium]